MLRCGSDSGHVGACLGNHEPSGASLELVQASIRLLRRVFCHKRKFTPIAASLRRDHAH